MLMNDELREMVVDGASTDEMREEGGSLMAWSRCVTQAWTIRIRRNVTTIEEVDP